MLTFFPGEMYLPFAEMPNLRNIALTGDEYDDTAYLALTQGEGSIPQSKKPVGNDAPVNFGGGSKSGFKPVYDWQLSFSSVMAECHLWSVA